MHLAPNSVPVRVGNRVDYGSVLGIEGETDADWVLVDLGDVVVHVMQVQAREFYDLEGLWKVTIEERQNMQDELEGNLEADG